MKSYRYNSARPGRLLVGAAWVLLAWGCAVTPGKLFIEDSSKSFEVGTIIRAQTDAPVTFAQLLTDLNNRRIIYIGEKHTDGAHHKIQLKIIRGVFQKHPQLAVGLEMFDRTYQPVLDLWSAGDLNREEFLRKTQWYANWRYDFSLYSGILDFARQHHIRLVALNIPPYIPARIRVGGIENLSAAEKKFLPQKIDTSNQAHRDYVARVFKYHHFKGKVKFKDFYAAQCAWEDAMAEAVAQNIDGSVMVVLAGNGHIQFKYGIPDRAFKRTRLAFRTIYLAPAGDKVNLGVADYIWVTP